MNQTNLQAQTMLRRKQVESRTGLSRSTIYQYIRNGAFPAPIPLGARAVGWLESEVSAWISLRVSAARLGTHARRTRGAR